MKYHTATQCAKVQVHMMRYGGISSATAFTRYGITRLAARINDLRKILRIRTDMVTRNGKRFGVYRIA